MRSIDQSEWVPAFAYLQTILSIFTIIFFKTLLYHKLSWDKKKMAHALKKRKEKKKSAH